MKLYLKEAMLAYEKKNGEKMTAKRLAAMVWPDLKENTRNVRISNLMTGKTKRIDLDLLKAICKALGVPCDKLIGY